MTISIRNVVNLTVPQYLIITFFSTVSAFLVITKALSGVLGLVPVILSLSFTVLALNSLNQVYDIELDTVSKPNRPIPSKRVSIKEAKGVSIFFYLLALLFSILVNQWFFLLIIGFVVVSILYSLPPVRLRRLPFSALIFGSLFYAVIPFLSAWLVSFEVFPIVFFLFFWLIGVIMSSTKDFEDVEADKKFGIVNLCTVFGPRKALKIIFVSFPLLVLSLFFLSFFCFVDQKYIWPSVISLLVLIAWILSYKELDSKKPVITQSRFVTYGMLVSVLVQLLYGLTSIIV